MVSPIVFKTIPQGAATQTWAAVHPDAAQYNGEYFADCNLAKPSKHARDAKLAQRLWQVSEDILEDYLLTR